MSESVHAPTLRQAAEPDRKFHDLRHTYAALLIAQGAHPRPSSIGWAHSSITVTLDRYGHLFPALDDALTDALDATYRTIYDGDEAA